MILFNTKGLTHCGLPLQTWYFVIINMLQAFCSVCAGLIFILCKLFDTMLYEILIVKCGMMTSFLASFNIISQCEQYCFILICSLIILFFLETQVSQIQLPLLFHA